MNQTPDRGQSPPRLAEWILDRVIHSPIARLGLTGDLRESFAERRRTHGWLPCALWYWREVVAASGRYAIGQLLLSRGRRERHPHEERPFIERERTRMASIIQDFRYALRMLAKSPAMASLSILALTLGIGMPTIMFTVVNGVFEDLPVDQPDRVLRLFLTHEVRGGQRWNVGHHNYTDWQAQQTTFEDLAGFAREDVTLSGGDSRPLRRNAAFVTTNVFNVLRVRPLLGRSFVPGDAETGSTPVVLLSHGVWASRFAADPNVAGRILSVDGTPHTVIGVMPERFGFPENEDLWLPVSIALDGDRTDSPDLEVFGRLRDDASLQQAQLELRAIAARVADAYPESNQDISAGASPYRDGFTGDFALGLYTMLGAVSFVLLIACVNVANLLLARSISRRTEIAVRCALGASRRRVISQFLIESFVIAAIGGILGTGVAWLGVQSFNGALTSLIGLFWVDIHIDLVVLSFVMGAVLLASFLAGVLPALQASSVNVSATLKDAPRGDVSQGLRIGGFGKGLVVVEIALSCALLVVSGLLIKGVLQLKAVDFGMPLDEIVTGEVELPRDVYPTAQARVRFFETLEETINTIPGVRSTSLMSDIPGTIGFRVPVTVNGDTQDNESPRVGVLTVTPSFVDVLSAVIVDGRTFTSMDRAGAEQVVLVNQTFASRFFPNKRAVGSVVEVFGSQYAVVGVVPDLFMGSVNEPNANGPGIYFPLAQSGNVSMQLMVRTWQDPLSMALQVRDALESLDPNVALMDVDRVDHLVARETVVFEIFGRLFLVFGLVALLLASIGLYGVMTFTVRQRTREWGVRLALGATARDVVRLATKQAMVQMVIGLAVGLLIAGALSRPLASFFFLVEPWDGVVFTGIAGLLAFTGVLAVLAPVWRATRVDPVEAMRHE